MLALCMPDLGISFVLVVFDLFETPAFPEFIAALVFP